MARPRRCRRICMEPLYDKFQPEGIPGGVQTILTLDEYEVIRLIDFENRTHVQCAKQMNISRTTVTEIYETARYKLADCIVNGKTLVISGGDYNFCDGSAAGYCSKVCQKLKKESPGSTIEKKGANEMRIAVTYENGMIYQHFGHTAQFKVYDVEDGKVIKEQIVDTMGNGHGALAGFLTNAGVDTLICGGIGGGAQNALAQMGIKLYGGVSGSADEAVAAYLAGSLDYNPNVHCSHHEHEHSCGEHHCGEEKHGCTGNNPFGIL